MTRTRFLLQTLLFGLCLVALNVVVARLSRHSVTRQTVRRLDAAGPVTDLFLGNSLVAAGIDVGVWRRTRPEAVGLNAGLGASSPVEHNLLLRRGLATRPRRVVYGYFDRQLTAPVANGFGELVGNRALVYQVDAATAAGYLADDPATALRLRLTGLAPVLVDRLAIWSKVEKLRRRLGGIGMPPARTNRFGRAEDFALLEPVDADAFAAACDADVAADLPLPACVEDMIRLADRSGAEFVAVEMPMTARHRQAFYDTASWRRYRAWLAARIGRAGGHCIDASDWVADDLFADHLHLAPQGAAEFTRRLGRVLPGGADGALWEDDR